MVSLGEFIAHGIEQDASGDKRDEDGFESIGNMAKVADKIA